MQPESRKLLEDIRQATEHLAEFTRGVSFELYQIDAKTQSAVERQLEIVGEAVSQLAKTEPGLAALVEDHKRIIAFRNLLIHRYWTVDHAIVWGVLETNLPRLKLQIQALLADESQP